MGKGKGWAIAKGKAGARIKAKAKVHTGHLRNSILFTSLFIIVSILLVLFPVTYSITASILRTNSITYTKQLLQQVDDSINYYIDGMISVSDYIVENQNVVDYIAQTKPATDAAVKEELKTVAGTRPDFVNLIIFREDGSFVSNRDQMVVNPNWDYMESSWYKDALNAEGEPVFSSSRVENVVAGEYDWVISMSRALYTDGHLSGVLLVDLNYQQISDICSSLYTDDSGYIFIVGADGRLVYHPQQRLVYSGIKTERFDLVTRTEGIWSVISGGNIYTSSLSPTSGWVTVSVFDTNKLVSISSDVVILFVAIGLFFSIITFIISYVASKRLTDPILQLKASMKQFEKGDFDAKANITVNNEVAELGESFNVMTEQIKNLVKQELLIEEQKRISELQALQAQIRPHFLYNTLESIIWMSEIGETEKVIEMTSSLSKLFRATTSNASELVTLKTEIDYVTNYMKIQKMRYQDKLNYRIDVDESILQAKVIKLIIQPMVENAIYHGIKQLKGHGLIVVSAYSEEKKLFITISDNGVGFDKGLLDGTADLAPKDESGIGINNVRDRIKLFFGSEYGITIKSTDPEEEIPEEYGIPGMRTTVTLTLPLIFE